MRIVHVASELAPVAKAGGLGDVIFGLCRQLISLGHEVEVILPDYPFLKIPDNVQGITVRKIAIPGEQIYGCPDDAKRFTSFCRKAIKMIGPYDVVHLHDWHTAAIAAFLPRTLLTIHNLAYVGPCDLELLQEMGIKDPTPFQDKGGYSLLKGGIHYAGQVNTVSPTYAKEIRNHPYIKPYRKKLSGILNGIDMKFWNPQIDPFLTHHYSAYDLLGKKKIQTEVRRRFELKESPLPIVGAITRLVEQKSPDLLHAALIKTRALGGQFILLGAISDPKIGEEFMALKKSYAHDPHVHIELTFNEKLSHLIYGASDLFIVPSRFEPCGLTQLIAMRYGAVPIVHKTGGLADTVFDKVNGFLIKSLSAKTVEKSLEKAFSLFLHKKQSYDALQKNGMESDFSFRRTAADYLVLYHALQQ